jgi:general secretion pathway protein I
MRIGCRRQRGFSLLEVLVAFAILALTLGALLQIFASGARSATVTDGYARAVEVAESTLARAGTELPLAPGIYEGEEQEFHWLLELVQVQPTELRAPPPDLTLLQLTARVSWADGERQRVLTLTSLRVQRQ